MSDPINALDGLWARVRYGSMHRFTFSQAGDWSGVEVETLLRQYHIPVFGRSADDDEVGIDVKAKQAKWAEWILCQAGVPLTCELIDPRNAKNAIANARFARPWGKAMAPKGWIGHLVAAMGTGAQAIREELKIE